MKILVACECSGKVRNAFKAEILKRGLKLDPDARAGEKGVFRVISCDIEAADDGEAVDHYEGPVQDLLALEWDLIVAHPPCTYLSNSGVSWLNRQEGRWKLMEDGCAFFSLFLHHPCKHVAIENPIMHGYAVNIIGRKYDQIIQPWQYGHDASKATCLWLKGLPLLHSTKIVEPTMVNGRAVYANQTPSGQNKLGPSPDRAKLRSETYQGIAEAMANQWIGVLL